MVVHCLPVWESWLGNNISLSDQASLLWAVRRQCVYQHIHIYIYMCVYVSCLVLFIYVFQYTRQELQGQAEICLFTDVVLAVPYSIYMLRFVVLNYIHCKSCRWGLKACWPKEHLHFPRTDSFKYAKLQKHPNNPNPIRNVVKCPSPEAFSHL